MAFFSVVIPLYNKENQVKRTLESVLRQNFKDFEVIIVDDGSTDASFSVVKNFSDQRIKVYQQKNSGASSARNLGIEKASSKYIALIDADDIWYSNHLKEFHKSIKSFPQASFFCNAYQLKLRDNYTHSASYNLEDLNSIQVVKDYFKASIIHPLAMTSGIAFTKSSFLEVGGFNTHISSGQDIDLWIRFALQKTIVFNPAVTACYDRTVPDSLSKKQLRKVKFEFLNAYKSAENSNASFKKYLDLNRYSVALHCKYHNDTETLDKFLKAIDLTSLNAKQRFLLALPNFVLIRLKKIQRLLINKGIYLTAFK